MVELRRFSIRFPRLKKGDSDGGWCFGNTVCVALWVFAEWMDILRWRVGWVLFVLVSGGYPSVKVWFCHAHVLSTQHGCFRRYPSVMLFSNNQEEWRYHDKTDDDNDCTSDPIIQNHHLVTCYCDACSHQKEKKTFLTPPRKLVELPPAKVRSRKWGIGTVLYIRQRLMFRHRRQQRSKMVRSQVMGKRKRKKAKRNPEIMFKWMLNNGFIPRRKIDFLPLPPPQQWITLARLFPFSKLSLKCVGKAVQIDRR